MGLTPDLKTVEDNPLYPLLVDYHLIEQVAQRVEAIEDLRLGGIKAEVSSVHQQIKNCCLRTSSSNECHSETRNGGWRELSPEELVAFSQQVLGDVCQFVISVMSLYRTLRTYRPLTAEEMKQGDILRQLLTSMQQLLPDRITAGENRAAPPPST